MNYQNSMKMKHVKTNKLSNQLQPSKSYNANNSAPQWWVFISQWLINWRVFTGPLQRCVCLFIRQKVANLWFRFSASAGFTAVRSLQSPYEALIGRELGVALPHPVCHSKSIITSNQIFNRYGGRRKVQAQARSAHICFLFTRKILFNRHSSLNVAEGSFHISPVPPLRLMSGFPFGLGGHL